MAQEHADAETSAQLLDAFKVLAGDKVGLSFFLSSNHKPHSRTSLPMICAATLPLSLPSM
jgi:hypothetical protein